jgi:hypothetical protein
VYVVEIKQKEKEVALKEKRERLLHLKKDDVTHVELNSKERGKIRLEKVAKNWVLTEPVKTKADERAVGSLIVSIVDAKREKLLEDKEVDWKEYGLDKPNFTITVGTKEERATISFGMTNPTKSSYYARVNDAPNLLLVADTLKNGLNKTPFDLRDKTVVAVAPADVDRIVISTKGKEIEIERQGPNKWRMTRPREMKVKESFVKANLRGLTNLEARRIIDDPGKEAGTFGLENPEMTILLAGKKLQQALVIGNSAEEGKGTPGLTPDRYARIKGRDTVYVIDARVMKNLKADPEKIRDRSILECKPAEIERMDISLDGKKWAMSRGKDKRWSLESPENKKAIETWPVTGILWDLKGLQWKSREKPSSDDLGSFHLKNPKLVISLLKIGDKEPIVVKAGWPETQEKPVEPGEQTSEKSAPQRGGAASEKKEHVEKSSEDRTGKAVGDKADSPEPVNVVVQPHPEKGTVFVVDGSFVRRLRDNLKKIVTEGK